MASTAQPPWRQPQLPTDAPLQFNLPDLEVYNSLTKTKNKFIPEKSDAVTW